MVTGTQIQASKVKFYILMILCKQWALLNLYFQGGIGVACKDP
jgi:hypothetical protein